MENGANPRLTSESTHKRQPSSAKQVTADHFTQGFSAEKRVLSTHKILHLHIIYQVIDKKCIIQRGRRWLGSIQVILSLKARKPLGASLWILLLP